MIIKQPHNKKGFNLRLCKQLLKPKKNKHLKFNLLTQ